MGFFSQTSFEWENAPAVRALSRSRQKPTLRALSTTINGSIVAMIVRGECSGCGASNRELVAHLVADPQQNVCEVCHADPQMATEDNQDYAKRHCFCGK